MKKLMSAIILLGLAGVARSGSIEQLAVSGNFGDIKMSEAPKMEIPVSSPVEVKSAEVKGSVLTAAKKLGKMSCTLDSGIFGDKDYVISFDMGKLLSETETGEISVTPKQSYLEALNENLQVREKPGKLELFGDSDGFFLVYLTLYADSGFTKGNFRLKSFEGNGFEKYSAVTCKSVK